MKIFTPTTLLITAIFVIAGLSSHQVGACSPPLPFPTFEEQADYAQHVDAQYVFGRIKLDANNNFAGFVSLDDPVENDKSPINYYLTYNYKSWKSFCSPSTEGSYDIVSFARDGSACGYPISPGWYIMGTFYKTLGSKIKTLAAWNLIRSWENFTYEEYQILENLLPTPCLPPP